MNQYVSPEVQALARVVFDRFKGQNTILHAVADVAAQPLLSQLIKEGLITEFNFIEWQGMCEFGQIVVFYYENEASSTPCHAFRIFNDFTFVKDTE